MSGHQSSSSKSSCADIIRRQTQNDFCCFPSVSIVPLHCLLNLRIFYITFCYFSFMCKGWVTVYQFTRIECGMYTITTTTVLWPFFRDHPGEPVPEENFCTLWCKRRLTEADTLTIRLGATPSWPTSAYLCHLPIFFTGLPATQPTASKHRRQLAHSD